MRTSSYQRYSSFLKLLRMDSEKVRKEHKQTQWSRDFQTQQTSGFLLFVISSRWYYCAPRRRCRKQSPGRAVPTVVHDLVHHHVDSFSDSLVVLYVSSCLMVWLWRGNSIDITTICFPVPSSYVHDWFGPQHSFVLECDRSWRVQHYRANPSSCYANSICNVCCFCWSEGPILCGPCVGSSVLTCFHCELHVCRASRLDGQILGGFGADIILTGKSPYKSTKGVNSFSTNDSFI